MTRTMTDVKGVSKMSDKRFFVVFSVWDGDEGSDTIYRCITKAVNKLAAEDWAMKIRQAVADKANEDNGWSLVVSDIYIAVKHWADWGEFLEQEGKELEERLKAGVKA